MSITHKANELTVPSLDHSEEIFKSLMGRRDSQTFVSLQKRHYSLQLVLCA